MSRWSVTVALAATIVAMSGCTATTIPDGSDTASGPRPSPSALVDPVAIVPVEGGGEAEGESEGVAVVDADLSDADLSAFERQLPLEGEFVSQAARTSGTVRIERRADGSVWVILDDFSTGDATDARLLLKWDPLVLSADGYWVSSEDGWDLNSIDPELTRHEIEVPGAREMGEIRSVTIMDYAPPSYPSMGSAALSPAE